MRYVLAVVALVLLLFIIGCESHPETKTVSGEMYIETDSGVYCYTKELTVPYDLFMEDSLAIQDSLMNIMMKDLGLEASE